MAFSSELAKQGWHLSALLCTLCAAVFGRRASAWLLFCGALVGASNSWAIPPNTPISNTATVNYSVASVVYVDQSTLVLVTDAGAGNSAPYALILNPATVAENEAGGVVGALSVSDLDPSDTHSFVVSDPRFAVVGMQLQLVSGTAIDFESEPVVPITITVTDTSGATYVESISIAVLDVNEAPTDIVLDDQSVVIDQAGAVVGNLSVVDPDAGDSHTYSVDDARFEIVAGQLKLIDGMSLGLGESVDLSVTATDSGGLFYSEIFSVSAVPPGGGSGVNASLNALQYAPGLLGSQAFSVGATQCDAGTGFVDLPAPQTYASGTVPINTTADYLNTNILKAGDALLLQVIDADANLDDNFAERVTVTLSTATGELETLNILETDNASGIFVGYIQSRAGAIAADDCVLDIDTPQTVTLQYTDANNALDSVSLNVLVDPFGVVFDSASGRLIDGAVITLVDAATNNATLVYDDDGVTPFPATITSGDGSRGFTTGNYRYPFVVAGDYVLAVTPPNRFAHPSVATDVQLQSLPGAPYALGAGARGQTFNVPIGPAVRVDIPLDLLPVVPTQSEISLFAASAVGGASTYVAQSQCFNGNQFSTPGAPTTLALGTLSLPGSPQLIESGRFARGDALFIQVIDPDQDLDPFAPDNFSVEVRAVNGDIERVLLVETNASTGVFSGYLQTSTNTAATANNCAFEGGAGTAIEVRYQDASDPTDSSQANAIFDPQFTTFSSADGRLVSGAVVTLVDALSGLPAVNATFAADGVTPFPVTITVGGTAQDNAGGNYDFAPGSFLYPVIVPGTYRLEVQAPVSYVYPSVVSDVDLIALDGGLVLTPASKGGDFTVSLGAPAAFDIPLDPISAEVFVSKQVNKQAAAVGEFVQYRVEARNADDSGTISSVRMLDTLPLGFRLAEGSLQVEGLAADEFEISSTGQDLVVTLANLGPGESVEIRYVTEITPGAKLGIARNEATVTGVGVGRANVAFADIQVTEDLLQSKAILVGQVFQGACDGPFDSGMPDVRIWLEDGTFVVTDAEGKYHFEGVEPGSHVVQLDLASVPDGYEVALCEQNTRFAGSAHSQFVDVKGGDLWRADFYISRKADQTSDVYTRLDATAKDGIVRYTFHLRGGAIPLVNVRATLMLDDQLAFIEGSATVNGAQVSDPTGLQMGAPTFKLPDSQGEFAYTLSFDAFVKAPRGLIETKAVAMFASAGGQHRSDVNVNELSLNWPSSLVMIAESVSRQPAGYESRPANRRALVEARQVNNRRLPQDRKRDVAAKDEVSIGIQSEVLEPTRGANTTRSNISNTQISVASPTGNLQPYQIPEVDRGQAPPFDLSWLAANKDNFGIAWPPERYNPALPAVEVTVVHPKDQKAVLLVDGEIVNPVTYEGTTVHQKLGVSFSRWDNVSISERDSLIEAHFLNVDGETVQRFERPIHFSGAPARAELVQEQSYLVADGLYPPVVAIRLFDRAGYPLRAGSTGEFFVSAPYQPLDKAKHLENLDNQFNNLRYQVVRDGIAFVQLEPTTSTGEVVVSFEFDRVRSDTVRARLVPGARDWIMVGLLEGIYAHNDISGDLDGLGKNNLEDETITDGRMAFYAKGMVKGDWLLTLAYDTDKKFERKLREQIDPNQFYTLYGDGTQQLYDAESQRKLYLKVERSRFSGLFGDFDTDFEKSELARYDRRMNGAQFGFYGEHIEVNAFASETDQGFVLDELRGDGTSGVYRLSKDQLVVNSEVVRIVTRDRFSAQDVIEREELTRFVDYTIDYNRGTLIFKQPIFSQDQNFNPIVIEVEYEVVQNGADEDVVAGTRIAYRLDNADSEVALTYVNDGTEGQGGDLLAGDLTWQINEQQKLTLEYARTETDVNDNGTAYLFEFEHAAERMAGRVYAREQEDSFGLGNQSALELGTRKVGVEGEMRFTDDILLRAQTFQQTALRDDSDRWVINALGEWRRGETQFRGGLQGVREDTASGQSADATQVLFGVSQNLLRKKLVLRGDAEIDLSSGGGNTDYPSRAVLGAEYEIFSDVSIIGEQELTWGDGRDTQDTRFGVRARPWKGGDFSSMLTRENGENAERLFATTGLLQQWRLSERWLYDVGFDRVQTLRESSSSNNASDLLFNPVTPPASGSIDRDFTAFFTGVGYRYGAWDASSRFEWHAGDDADKWNVLLGANHQLADGKVISASLSVLNEESARGAIQDNIDLRVGFAWRPFNSAWTFLNRTDLIFEKLENQTFDTRSRKWVNNFNANYKLRDNHQVAFQLGLKYVVDDIDATEYDATTALYGFTYRYDLSARWDIAVMSSAHHSFASDTKKYAYGAAIGHNFMQNMWVSVGYNFDGFEDEDFVGADYTAKGPYIKIRMKFDQALAKRFLEFAGLAQTVDRQRYANGR